MTDLLQTFRTEANEHLVALEEALLELEENPTDEDLIAQAFRAMHTIKGAGGMFGFDDLSQFTHHVETALDKVRSGEYGITTELISIILDAKDHIESLLEDPHQTPEQASVGEQLLARLNEVIPTDGTGATAAKPAADTPQPEHSESSETDEVAYRIHIKPTVTALQDGFDMKPILRELGELGNCQTTIYDEQLPNFEQLKPQECVLEWEVFLSTSSGLDKIRDVFIFVQDEWQLSIDEIASDEFEGNDQLGKILVNRAEVSEEKINEVLAKQSKTGELLKDAGLVSDKKIEAALAEQNFVRQSRQKKQQQEQESTVRVPANKLDSLMDLVGELVIVQARMNQIAYRLDDEEIITIAESLDRLTTDIRDNTFDIRMLPIGTTFSRFRRLVRDLSRDLGKQIRLVTEGAETELDKMVIDRLADPMVHLIRNSIDHGIEAPENRAASGKTEEGTIHLSAMHAESHVYITIKDDGKGLDPDKIKQKAIYNGLINADDVLSEDECYNLIFQPGFSTAAKVTDVSGRGVGMDVVKRSIESLRGEVNITSELGQGTTTTIRLPMTLAIIEGLMVSVSGERYVLPLNCVEECIELSLDSEDKGITSRKENRDNHLIKIRGKLIPYIRLRDWYSVPGESTEIEQIVIVNYGEQHFGFCVDQVIGQYQTVIKSLGMINQGGETGLAGATITGDGGVAMILDVNQLIASIQNQIDVAV